MSHLGDDCHAAAMFVSLLCFPARMFDFLRRVMRLRRILRAFAFGVFFVLVCAFVFYLHYTADAGFELGFKKGVLTPRPTTTLRLQFEGLRVGGGRVSGREVGVSDVKREMREVRGWRRAWRNDTTRAGSIRFPSDSISDVCTRSV